MESYLELLHKSVVLKILYAKVSKLEKKELTFCNIIANDFTLVAKNVFIESEALSGLPRFDIDLHISQRKIVLPTIGNYQMISYKIDSKEGAMGTRW